MPTQQRLRRHDRRHVSQNLASQSLRFGSQPASLVICESQPSFAELLAKHAVLLAEVLDRLQLAFIHPSGNRDENEPERIQNSRHLVGPLSSVRKPGPIL